MTGLFAGVSRPISETRWLDADTSATPTRSVGQPRPVTGERTDVSPPAGMVCVERTQTAKLLTTERSVLVLLISLEMPTPDATPSVLDTTIVQETRRVFD